jgi:hypothetical protein
MKRIVFKSLFVMLACAISVGAIAQTMCVRDKSLVISLDKNTGGTGSGYNASEMIWWTDFSYGRIYGEATCLSAAEGLGRTAGTGAYYGVEEYATTPITAEVGLNGKDANGDERKYCWCRATHPVSSRWVFHNATLRRPIASRIARTTAVTASRLTPLCAGACLGRSASDVPSNIEYV